MSAVELLAPAGSSLERAAASLDSRLALREGALRRLAVRFYDTFDGRVRAAGLTLRHEQADAGGEGTLVLCERDGGRVRAAASAPPLGDSTLALQLPDGELRRALLEVIDVRALLAAAEVRARELELAVLDEQRKTVARGRLCEPELRDDGATGLAVRLALEPLRGFEKELEGIRRRLLEGGFVPARRTLVDEAIAARGRRPGGVSSKVAVALIATQRSDAAAVAVLRRLAEVMDANLDGAANAIDPEFLHDYRVALRRTRSVLKQLGGVFPPAELQYFRDEFRRLQRATGEARDLDVHVTGFEAMRALVPERLHADLEPLRAVLSRRRELAHRACARELRSERALRLREQWQALLQTLVELPGEQRPAAERPIGELAGERIVRVYRAIVKRGRAIAADSPAAEYHELRKQGKELRYLLELFGGPLYDPRVVRSLIGALKGLQDVLGRHQDREVQVGMLRSLSGELALAPGGPAALMATGVLVERLCEDELAARAEFAGAFSSFAARRRRRAVRETFGS
jgi:CHAD domain-containing protein